MNELDEQFLAVLNHLNAIALKNFDDFNYKIDLETDGKSVLYRFTVTESADGHEFLSVSAKNLEEISERIGDEISQACEEWGYEY